jgi:hypothetical protein
VWMKAPEPANEFVEEEKREEKSKKSEERRAHKEELALLKEKERVEKEELKLKVKMEKEQAKERHRFLEEENRKSRGKGKARESLVIGTVAAAAMGSQPDEPASSQAPLTAASIGRPFAGSPRSTQSSTDEDDRPMTSKSTEESTMISPRSPIKRQSKVKSWFTGKFYSNKPAKDGDEGNDGPPGFFGGASLIDGGSTTAKVEDNPMVDSKRDFAVAGKLPPVHPIVTKPQSESSVSPIIESQGTKPSDSISISTLSESDEVSSDKKGKRRRGRVGFKARLLGKTNPKTSNDTDEDEFEEARDTFEEEKLAPPPKLTAAIIASKPSASPVRDSRFSEIL